MLRRIIRVILLPLHRFLIVRMTPVDPWEVQPAFQRFMHPARLGPGSTRAMAWYFEGPSIVMVRTVEEIVQWLAACEYIHDADLFHESDYWQHPKTFEQLRRGDCEDHALWAWRKLVELGYAASLFVGQWKPESPDDANHAWVVFDHDGESYVLEPVAKDPAGMVRPLAEVRLDYLPHYSVDSRYRIEPRGGLIAYWQQQELQRRARTRARPAPTVEG